MKIGILSDTHDRTDDVRIALALLVERSVELLVHCGDIESVATVRLFARRQRQLIEAALGAGLSVVVDKTNATREDRAALIALGRSFGARVVGYFFESRVKDCLERNGQRVGKERVPDVALFATRKRLEMPEPAEWFDALFFVRLTGDGTFAVREWKHRASHRRATRPRRDQARAAVPPRRQP